MNPDWGAVADVVAGACLIGGSLLAFAAGVGVVRFPDLLSRMHTAAKPQVLGQVLVLLGLALRLRDGPGPWVLLLVVIFQLLTSPVAAHMVGRAGYRTGKVGRELLVVDELTADQDDAARAMLEPGAAETLAVAPSALRDGARDDVDGRRLS